MIKPVTYPVFLGAHFELGSTKWKARLIHNKPSMRGAHYYSQRYTGIEFGPFRIGLVWKNPPNDCACEGCQYENDLAERVEKEKEEKSWLKRAKRKMGWN